MLGNVFYKCGVVSRASEQRTLIEAHSGSSGRDLEIKKQHEELKNNHIKTLQLKNSINRIDMSVKVFNSYI